MFVALGRRISQIRQGQSRALLPSNLRSTSPTAWQIDLQHAGASLGRSFVGSEPPVRDTAGVILTPPQVEP